MDIIRKKKPKFLDLDARLFHNSSNGQLSISLPKRQLKELIDLDDASLKEKKNIPIRIFKWRNK